MDETWGCRDVWGKQSRGRLLMGIAFCCGWLPKDNKPSSLDKIKLVRIQLIALSFILLLVQ